jgi:peptide/nickel transport system substrate-binding protein
MGTGEFMFWYSDFIPWDYVKGNLIESWDLSVDKAVLHVRPGIYWAADNVDWMENRELTAEDIAFDINHFWEDPWGTRFDGTLKLPKGSSVYAEDKYTVVCEFETFNNQFMYYIGFEDRAVYSPPELEDNSPQLWKNQVGTGAFLFEDYIVGSYMSYVKNPNYWDTTVIDGVEYQMPFVDRVIFPIIPDVATQMAALRTGKVDYHMAPPIAQWETIDRLSPDLISVTFSTGGGSAIGLNCTEPPFDEKEVRQAMIIGTDVTGFMRLLHAESLPQRWWPSSPANPAVYIPTEDLPAATQVLFTYNPTLAKQMLADAGYPEGFRTSIYVSSGATSLDIAALAKDQWVKIGVEADIVSMDPSTLASYQYAVTYEGTVVAGLDAANPIVTLVSEAQTGAWFNFAGYSNAAFDEVMDELAVEFDTPEQNRLCKEGALTMLEEFPYIPLSPTVTRVYWWPWLNNYYGEFSLSDGAMHSMIPYMWIDQGLKAEMGY